MLNNKKLKKILVVSLLGELSLLGFLLSNKYLLILLKLEISLILNILTFSSSCPPILIFLSYSNENIGSNDEEQLFPYDKDNVPAGATLIHLPLRIP